MGWPLFSWLFGEKEEKTPKLLTLGAELVCPCGSKHSFLIVHTDCIDISNLPQACVLDRKEFENIQPFGECKLGFGAACADKMILADRWENPEPQGTLVNGEELITTKSTLICRRSGKAIRAVTSGQDGVMAAYISEALELLGEMKEKYPGLSDILLDPNGSLYLNGEMYKEAIRFIEDCVEKHNGEIKITDIFDENDMQMLLIREALGKLMPSCDERRIEKLIDGLMIRGTVNGMDSVAGWDPHLLNKEMIEMLRRDSADTAERIETKSFYRWDEEHKKSIDKLADGITELAYAVLCAKSMMVWFPLEQEATKVGEAEPDPHSPMFGEDWNSYFNETYGQDNVTWDSFSIQDFFDTPSKITDFTPQQLAGMAQANGWSVEPLGKGCLKGVPYEQGGGFSMHAPNGGSEYIQYHPGGGHHGDLPYYKISSGPNGILRFWIGGIH